MTPQERTSILIPTYRGADVLERCLESLVASADPAAAEVIVVDDASGDGTARRVRERFPEVVVVERESNGGFVRAVNDAFARASRREFVAVLNDDTIVDPQWLRRAVAALDADPRLGVAVPLVTQLDDPSILDSAGQGYTISGWAYRRGHGEPVGPPYAEPHEVFGPTGCAMVLRRGALKEPFLFRDDLECYYEDVDLAFRLRRAGWSCLCVPQSVVRHGISHSYSKRAAHRAYCVSRNLETVFWSHLPRRLLWRAVWDHLLLVLLQAILSIRRGQLRAYLAGKAAFVGAAMHRRAPAPPGRPAAAAPPCDLAPWIERRWLRRAVAAGRRHRPQDAGVLRK